MVFKADFVADLGGPKEAATVDPKLAYYLGDTLKQQGQSTGKIAEAIAGGVIAVDTAYQTKQLADKMIDNVAQLEQGDIAKTNELEAATAQFEWEKQTATEATATPDKATMDGLTSAYQSRVNAIEAAYLQKGITYKEFVYRNNRALQEAIAARPALANEFRQISGRYTGTTDWDHVFIKQEEEVLKQKEVAAAARTKKELEQQYQAEKDTIEWYAKKFDIPFLNAKDILNDPKMQGFVQTQVQLAMGSKLALNQVEQAKAQGNLTTENFRGAFNAMVGEGTYKTLSRHAAMLTKMNSGPMAKYNKEGSEGFDYAAAANDPVALTWLKNSLLQEINSYRQGYETVIAGTFAGTQGDPTKYYSELDAWVKRTEEMLTKSPTAALDALRVMRETRNNNFADAMTAVNGAATLYKNIGINGDTLLEYERLGKDAFAKLHPGSVESVERYKTMMSGAAAMTSSYTAQAMATMQSIGSGVPITKPRSQMTEDEKQGDMDARRIALDNTITSLIKGSANPSVPETINTVNDSMEKVVPKGASWDGPSGLYKAITNGNFGKYLEGLTLEDSINTRSIVSTKLTDYLKNFTTTTVGVTTISRALGGKDYANKYVLTPIPMPEDEYGISVPKYQVTLTEKAKAEIAEKTAIVGTGTSGPVGFIQGVVAMGGMDGWDYESQRKRMEDNLNKALADEFLPSYKSGHNALTILRNVPVPTKRGAAKPTQPVPKNTNTLDKWWED